MRKMFLIGAATALLAVPPTYAAASLAQPESRAWRQVATEQDRLRIRDWRRTWVQGLSQARRKFGAEVEQAGALLDPDAALLQPAPPPGEYRCRTIKIGGRDSAMFDWIAYPDFRCRIARDGEVLSFTRLGGSQRPIGRIYPDGGRRMIFLGSLQLGDERRILPYGTDPRRDMAGILERVGEQRWRLVFPRPAYESVLDVVELVPAG